MNTPDNPAHAPAFELLSAYVNGTATVVERQAVKTALAENPQVRAALAWHEALAHKVISDVESTPSDIGWAQLQARVRADARQRAVAPEAGTLAAPGAPSAHAAPHSQGIWARLLGALEAALPHRWMPAPALSGLCAVLVAVVAGQALYGGLATNETAYSDVRSVAPGPNGGALDGNALARASGLTNSRFVQLNFKEGVSERDMRLLLVRAGAVIVAGPGQLGDYTVAVPGNELSQALDAFKESLLTESVEAVAAPLARSGAGGASGSNGAPQRSTP